MLSVRVATPEHPPARLFTRSDVEPVLRQDGELVVLSGFWPERAMVRSRVVLHEETLVAIHIMCYPRVGFTEVWRYYVYGEGRWQRSSWQQLPIPARLRILEAYTQAASAFAKHPGSIPGQQLDRTIKHGATYLLVALDERGLVSLVNNDVVYVLEKPLQSSHMWFRSYPDRETLLLKWHHAAIATWATSPFVAAVVECSIGGSVQLSAGLVESEHLCPL